MKKKHIAFVFLCSTFAAALFFMRQLTIVRADQSCDAYTDPVQKQTCEKQNAQIADIDAQIKEYEQKLEATKQKEGDIKQNIDYLDNQIYLSKLRIQESEIVIEKRRQDIENLVNKIIILEDSLDKNTQLFLKRINLSYRQGNLNPLTIFFSNGSLYEKVNRYKYLQTVQTADRKFLFKIQETKNSYHTQQKLVEMEKKALEAENRILEQRKQVLASQMQEKETLLSQTQSEEKVLSATIEDLRQRRTALLGGASATGYGICDGCSDDASGYFNQRDSRWGNISLAYDPPIPPYYMKDWGCAVSSAAMVLKHLGANLTPKDIAEKSNYFDDVNIKWWVVGSDFGGKTPTIHWSGDWNFLSQKIDEGKWVIVQVMMSTGGHFVVVTGKDGNDYVIKDPYFSEKTRLSIYGSIYEVVVYE
jgi:peptidoglycan hydrolase CwlO-like protein